MSPYELPGRTWWQKALFVLSAIVAGYFLEKGIPRWWER